MFVFSYYMNEILFILVKLVVIDIVKEICNLIVCKRIVDVFFYLFIFSNKGWKL